MSASEAASPIPDQPGKSQAAQSAPTCYLCGQPILTDSSQDHVPPKQFFPSKIRQTLDLNLLTVPAHKRCNTSYQHDEDYFLTALGPLASSTFSGTRLWLDLARRAERPQGNRLIARVAKGFTQRPGRIYLPPGKIALRFEGPRVWRVAWKIIRGLFMHEEHRFLPDDMHYLPRLWQAGEPIPEEFLLVRDNPERGRYAGIFDYKYHLYTTPAPFYCWAMLLWDQIAFFFSFHDPECSCGKCRG